MSKKNMMRDFISKIESRGLMTDFIKNIFDYENIKDYNYIFRMIDLDEALILDIYDNVSEHRFNRYIFFFTQVMDAIKVELKSGICVHSIGVVNIENPDSKLLKLAYLFQLEDSEMLAYARDFLEPAFVEILADILK